jgi:hypothetical protein
LDDGEVLEGHHYNYKPDSPEEEKSAVKDGTFLI